DLDPLCRKRTRISEQRPPNVVMNIYPDVKFLIAILEPLAHVGNTGECHRELEANHSFIKALLSRAQAQTPAIIHTQVDVHREMLVSAKVIDNAAALLAVNHVSVKTARMASFEITNPCDGLSTERVEVSVVPDGEGNIGPIFGKHNSAPTAHIQKRQRNELAKPNLLNHASADGSAPDLAAESKALLK